MGASWRPKFSAKDVNIITDKQTFSGYSKINEMALQYPLFKGGTSVPLSREMIRRPEAIAALLYDPQKDNVIMVEQFRVGALTSQESPWLLEIVAGLIEEGDSPEETVYRETLEETGCKVEALIPIFPYLTTPGILNERIHLFCAKVSSPLSGSVHGITEEGEDIQVHVFSTNEAFELLEKGLIVSSPAIVALQWLKIHQSSLAFD